MDEDILCKPIDEESHRIHLLDSLQALQYLKNIHIPDDYPKLKFQVPEGKRLLVFDMDETLIHCVDDIQFENP
jgi:hypothetical protein